MKVGYGIPYRDHIMALSIVLFADPCSLSFAEVLPVAPMRVQPKTPASRHKDYEEVGIETAEGPHPCIGSVQHVSGTTPRTG